MKFKIVNKDTGKFFAALGAGMTSEERAYHFTKEDIDIPYIRNILWGRSYSKYRLKVIL